MITKEAKNKENFIYKRQYFNSARNAFQFLLENIITSKDDVILMPEYIGQSNREGSGVFDPIRNTAVHYEFYSLNKHLQVDIKDIKNKLKNDNVKAVLLIHYFGFPQKEILNIKKICNDKNIILIEDCAHTMASSFSNQKLGTIGDFSFYSIHKILPSENGGILQINNPQIPLKEPQNNFISNADFNILINSDLNKISEKRLNNYLHYQKLYNKESFIYEPIYTKIDDGAIPLNYPILIKNVSRENLYFELINRNIPTVALYYQLISELRKSEHQQAFFTSKHILNLPVHQDIELEDIELILNELNKIEDEIKRGDLTL